MQSDNLKAESTAAIIEFHNPEEREREWEGRGGERDGERQRQTDRERKRQTDTQRERDRDRQTTIRVDDNDFLYHPPSMRTSMDR